MVCSPKGRTEKPEIGERELERSFCELVVTTMYWVDLNRDLHATGKMKKTRRARFLYLDFEFM